MTYWIFGMVKDVSAIFVDKITLLPFVAVKIFL
jgi:hypothetical protein